MGAKQSKRSVDISGKEAESAGEVAAAGAGGEGRVEQLADADALKPQLNGDAHIHEQTNKEKELDSGTPENEKDATTEKEGKPQEDEKEVAPVTNGESEQKVENGDSTPTSEDGKKPKKEKVKKKWSLRSISFSRKDKPKQEKKQKEEELKTNGEPEKVPEETAEVAPEANAEEATEETKTEIEPKEEQTPETPVTEPITNGSSTPESAKVDTPVIEEPVAASPEIDRPTPKSEPEPEPEQLPVNGLTLEEPIKENIEVEKIEESKPEEPTTETTEIVPDIPVKKEVCVEQMPLIEPTPPPLPANPPPSSVASFAATTMAPELTDASLPNTADTAIPTLLADSNTKDKINDIPPEIKNDLPGTETDCVELPPPLNEVSEETSVSIIINDKNEGEGKEILGNSVTVKAPTPEPEIDITNTIDGVVEQTAEVEGIEKELCVESAVTPNPTEVPEVQDNICEDIEMPTIPEVLEVPDDKSNTETVEMLIAPIDISQDIPAVVLDGDEELPSPPPPICDDIDNVSIIDTNGVKEKKDDMEEGTQETEESLLNSTHISDAVETATAMEKVIVTDNDIEKLKNRQNDLIDPIETIECNGNVVNEETIPAEESTPVETTDDTAPKDITNSEIIRAASAAGDCPPLAEPAQSPSLAEPAPPATLQEPLPAIDKITEMIPEVPAIPEINTETLQETTTDVAVAN